MKRRTSQPDNSISANEASTKKNKTIDATCERKNEQQSQENHLRGGSEEETRVLLMNVNYLHLSVCCSYKKKNDEEHLSVIGHVYRKTVAGDPSLEVAVSQRINGNLVLTVHLMVKG